VLSGGIPIGQGLGSTLLARSVPAVGNPLFAVVLGTPEAPFLLFAGKRVDLGAESGLRPGQELTATLVRREGGFFLQLDDAATSPPTTNAPTNAAAGGLGNVLAQLATLGESADLAALLPPTPSSDAAVRNLIALFRQADTLGPRLQQLTTLLRSALPANHPMLAVLAAMADDFAGLQSGDPARVAKALRNLADNRAPESRLAGASPAQLAALKDNDLASILQALRDGPESRAALAGAGLLDEFSAAVDDVLARIDGARAQQLHGTTQGYTFLDLPLPQDSGFAHAMVHLYHEGDAQGPDAAQLPTVAVLDLELDQLGPLWLELRALGGTCQCTLLATTPAVRALLDEHRSDLARALEESGFAQASVRTGDWNGDRLGQTGALLGGFRPLDVQG